MAAKKNKTKLDFVSDDYLRSVRDALKAMKPKPGRSRERAVRFLEQQVSRLLKSGYTAKEIMDTVNKDQVVISAADISKIIDKICVARNTDLGSPKIDDNAPEGATENKEEIKDGVGNDEHRDDVL